MTYAPLLNLKLAQKKTSVGSVPMVRHSYLCIRTGGSQVAEEPIGRLSVFPA